MAKKDAGSNPQHTYTVKELQPGTVYRDALSGYLVLTLEREVTVNDACRNRTVEKRLVGWFWNPVFGKHQEMALHDHQLIRAEADTALMPDTRYKNGYHGL